MEKVPGRQAVRRSHHHDVPEDSEWDLADRDRGMLGSTRGACGGGGATTCRNMTGGLQFAGG